MFINLDDAKSLSVILIENSLDARGLTGSGVSKQQAVICPAPCKECFRVLPQLLFLDLIADQVIKLHVDNIRDRYDIDHIPALMMNQPERFMQAKLSAPEITVEQLHMLFKLFRITGRRKPAGQFLDPVADTAAGKPSVISAEFISRDHLIQRYIQRLFNIRKPVRKQLPENTEVMKRDPVEAAIDAPPDLACP